MKNIDYKSVIRACRDCAKECIETGVTATNQGLFKKDDIVLLLDRNCADICSLTASLLQRGFSQAEHLARECAKNCEAFAAECSKYENNFLRRCAEACLKCAAECRKLLVAQKFTNAAA
jgi:hypothetical protein